MVDLDLVYDGPPPVWLQQLDAEPREAVERMLLGTADAGLRSADEPTNLLHDWLAALGDRCEFAAALDAAFADWIDHRWGQPLLAGRVRTSALTALAWCRLADTVAADARLSLAAGRLRAHRLPLGRREDGFLADLTSGRSRDPEGRAWLALARHQTDRSLAVHWWRLVHLDTGVPWYRGAYGLHGLRGLPPDSADPRDAGAFPPEVAEGLVQFGCALALRAERRWLPDATAQREWLRTARLTRAAYPAAPWDAIWDEQRQRRWPAALAGWLEQLAPARTGKAARWGRALPAWQPDWPQRANAIAAELTRGAPTALRAAEGLLRAQRHHAEATGDVGGYVKTLSNFAGGVKRRQPDLALDWLRTAIATEPSDPYNWTTLADALAAQGDLRGARAVAEAAVRRFPDNAHARTGLAEVLRAQGRLDDAERVYRATADRFPDNAHARTGLAEVLKAQGRLDDAERVYEGTIAWLEQTRSDPQNLDVAHRGLRGVHATRRGETPTHPEPEIARRPERVDWGPDDAELVLGDAFVLRRWALRTVGLTPSTTTGALRDEAARLLERLAPYLQTEAGCAVEAGLVHLELGELAAARALLDAAAECFPGNPQVLYARGRLDRAAARPSAEWDRLEQLDGSFRPAASLGKLAGLRAQPDWERQTGALRKELEYLGRTLANEGGDWAESVGRHVLRGCRAEDLGDDQAVCDLLAEPPEVDEWMEARLARCA